MPLYGEAIGEQYIHNPNCDLEVDSGIELHTIQSAYEAGARIFVAGTAVFQHARGPEAGVQSLIKTAQG